MCCRCDRGGESAKERESSQEEEASGKPSADSEEDDASGKPSADAPDTKATNAKVEAAVNEVFKPLIDDRWATGIIVGVVMEDDTHVVALGRLSPDDARPPDERTIFEIGSLTKVFTGTVLADMIEREEVKLDDPVGKLLPKGTPTLRRGGEEVSLEELATHSSGLPTIGSNFWLPGFSIYDIDGAGKSWSAYSVKKLYAYLASPDPPLAEEPAYAYSNLGMGLLGHVLALRAEKDYEALLLERVCEPLGMKDTKITLSKEDRERFAPGHSADGLPAAAWETSAIAGAFAIRSTMRDMLIFTKANLGLIETPLAPAIAATHRGRFKKNDAEKVGLGWNVNVHGVVYHTGTTGGYRSMIYLLPRAKVGVVVMSNTLVGGSTDGRAMFYETLGASLLNVLVGAPKIPVELPKPTKPDLESFDEYVGHYGKKDDVIVTRDGDALIVTISGRVPRHLYQEAPDVFFMKAYDAKFDFARDKEGVVRGVELLLSGKKFRLRREESSSPSPPAP